MTNATDAIGFEEVLAKELAEIRESRSLRKREQVETGTSAREPQAPAGSGSVFDQAHDERLIGLALSGGGIRSATFNLGVLQGLAELGLLPIFDYLSTVSGGGYIGAWLAAWSRREKRGIRAVAERLRPPVQATSAAANGPAREDSALRFLRSYSNYLTPQIGFLSFDSWTLAAVYLRNFLLNLVILAGFLSLLLLVPRLLLYAWGKTPVSPWWPYAVSLLLLLVGLFFIGRNLRYFTRTAGSAAFSPPWIRRLIVAPLFGAAALASWWMFGLARVPAESGVGRPWAWVLVPTAFYGACWLLGWALARRLAQRSGRASEPMVAPISWPTVVLSSVVAGAASGLLLWGVFALHGHWWSWSASMVKIPSSPLWPASALALSFGPPLVTLTFVLTAFLHTGLAGRGFPDDRREWVSRLSGWLLIYALGWSAVFAIALLGPMLMEQAHQWTKIALGSGWLASTLAGVLAGKSAKTSGGLPDRRLELLARVAPPIFVLGLLMALSVGLDTLLSGLPKNSPGSPRQAATLVLPVEGAGRTLRVAAELEAKGPSTYSLGRHLERVGGTVDPPDRVLLTLLAALLATWLARRVDINEFSMHLLYRNRLARCYLGASAKRRPHPFTGFYSGDDLLLAGLRAKPPAGEPYVGPYPIVNAAINLVHGRNLAWQERKAASFFFSPLYSGFDLPAAEEEEERAGPSPAAGTGWKAFRPTGQCGYRDGGIYLGTAMAISGAAASPNAGYHSSPAMTFLLTVFNVRLGWWFGNPRGPFWNETSPRWGLLYLLSELIGRTNDESDFVYLSDGGHFENLGIYELVKRRCRMIVACDATQDGSLSFADLGNAVRKCRIDLGIDVEIRTDAIHRREGKDSSVWHCAVGRIRYDRVDRGAAAGTLVYLKPSLTGDEPTDLRDYRARHPDFPHQSTGDQFFAESQFESYRKLGLHVAREVFEGALRQSEEVDRQNVRTGGHNEGLIAALRERWYPPSSATADHFTVHTATLDRLYERLRQDDRLKFLDGQFYPEWRRLQEMAYEDPKETPQPERWLPKDPEQLRAGFYFCNSLIQLMEDVYLDLDLDQEAEHPDNRGWMNLFKHWSWSGMLQVTWAISACTYGIRFQRFCERSLNLRLGQIRAMPLDLPKLPKELAAALGQAVADERLNPVEEHWILELAKELGTAGDLVTFSLLVKPPLALDDGEEAAFQFVFGFALVEDGALLYLRVQDHLRRMGLAREALKRLVKELGIRHLDPRVEAKVREKERNLLLFSDTDLQRCLRLFQSAQLEVDELECDAGATARSEKAAALAVNPDARKE